MSVKQKRVSYNASFKLTVVKYAKEHGNRAAERNFGRPPTEKMIREWRKQEEDLLKLQNKDRKTFRAHQEKWPQLEMQMKNWIMYHRSIGTSLSTKMIIFEARRWAAANGITDFNGTPSWCLRFMKRQSLSMRTYAASAQKMQSYNNITKSDSNEMKDSVETCEDEHNPAGTSSDMISEYEAMFVPKKAKKERKRITMQKKMDVIRRMESGERQSDVCKALSLAPSTVSTIMNNVDKIKRTYSGISADSLSRTTYSRSETMVEMERLLLQWMDDMRRKNVTIPRDQILETAKYLFDRIRQVYGSNETFIASKGWFHRFKNRSKINNINETAEDAQIVEAEEMRSTQYHVFPQRNTMNETFDKLLSELVSSKNKNNVYLSRDAYNKILEDVINAKRKTHSKTVLEYRRLQRYDVAMVGEKMKLISPITSNNKYVKYFATMDELFDIIEDAHLMTGHGGRCRVMNLLNTKYKNVTVESVMMYLNLCKECYNKNKGGKLYKSECRRQSGESPLVMVSPS